MRCDKCLHLKSKKIIYIKTRNTAATVTDLYFVKHYEAQFTRIVIITMFFCWWILKHRCIAKMFIKIQIALAIISLVFNNSIGLYAG